MTKSYSRTWKTAAKPR